MQGVRMVCSVGPADLPSIDHIVWGEPAHGGGCIMIPNPEGFEIVMRAIAGGRQIGFNAISRVIAGGEIPEHTDHHDNGCRERFHIPLQTNPKAFFITGGKRFHMKVGKAYVIDPAQPHSVVNGGKADRIHLIFNVLGG